MRSVDLIIIYRIIRILVTPWDKQPAFHLGIIDANGNLLKRSRNLKTAEEKNAFSLLYRFVFNLKRLLALVPGGKSKLGSLAAGLLLLKEDEETQLEMDVLFEANEIEEDSGVGGAGGGGMNMGGAPMAAAPTNHTGGSIALIDSPLFKKKKKLKKFSEQF
jgi:hypothetical protein